MLESFFQKKTPRIYIDQRSFGKVSHKVEGEDFHEAFAAVAKMTTVRCLLNIAAAKGWQLITSNRCK
jgi:hypothetical protein